MTIQHSVRAIAAILLCLWGVAVRPADAQAVDAEAIIRLALDQSSVDPIFRAKVGASVGRAQPLGFADQRGMKKRGIVVPNQAAQAGSSNLLYFPSTDIPAIQAAIAAGGMPGTVFNAMLLEMHNNFGVTTFADSRAQLLKNLAFVLMTWGIGGSANYQGHTTRSAWQAWFQATWDEQMVSTPGHEVFWQDIGTAFRWANYSGDLTAGEKTAYAGFVTNSPTRITDTMQLTSSARNPLNHRDMGRYGAYAIEAAALNGAGVADTLASNHLATWADQMTGANGFNANQAWYATPVGSFSGGANPLGYNYTVYEGYGGGGLYSTWLATEAYRILNGQTLTQMYGSGALPQFEYLPQTLLFPTTPFTVYSPARGTSQIRVGRSYQSPPGAFLEVGGYKTGPMLQMNAKIYGESGLNTTQGQLAAYMNAQSDLQLNYDERFDQRHVIDKIIHSNTVTSSNDPATLGIPLNTCQIRPGECYFRNTWARGAGGAATGTLVTIRSTPWDPSHSAYAPGCWRGGGWTMDRKGPLAVSAGGGAHHLYPSETWGQNGVLLFLDRTENPVSLGLGTYDYQTGSANHGWDAGGARCQNQDVDTFYSYTQLTTGSVFDGGGFSDTSTYRLAMKGSAAYLDFNFVNLDVTKGFNGTGHMGNVANTAKVALYDNYFFYKPDATPGSGRDKIISIIRATTEDTKFKKTLTFNPGGRFDRADNSTVAGHSASSSQPLCTGHNHTRYTTPATVTVTQNDPNGPATDFSGLLVWNMLYEGGSSWYLWKVGGPNGSGKWADDATAPTDSHEFELPIDCTNNYYYSSLDFDSVGNSSEYPFMGQYHYQLNPGVDALADVLVNTYEGMNVGDTPSASALITGTNVKGGTLGDFCALIITNSKTGTSGDFTFPASYTGSCAIGNLGAGSARTLTCGSDVTTLTNLGPGGGSLSGGAVTATPDSTTNQLYFSVVTGAGANRSCTIS